MAPDKGPERKAISPSQ